MSSMSSTNSMIRKPDSSKLLKLLAIGMFLAFAIAGLWLLFLAFEIGGVYPPFSSKRAELDGTEVLYEALERFPELRVVRHYGPASNAAGSRDTVVIVAGFSVLDWHSGEEDELRGLLRLADRGARLVIALGPSSADPVSLVVKKAREGKEKEEEEEEKKPARPVGERLLQVALKFDPQPKTATSQGRTVRQGYMTLEEKAESLPGRLPSRTRYHLEPRADAWRTVYSWNGRPALLARELGKGEIVLMVDSFLLTNRAMWEERHADFLTWLIGGRHRIVFYERHLGVAENPGVAWLIRRYNLDGVVVALLIVVALFVWRNSVALVPLARATQAPDNGRTVSRGSSLVALVSRSFPASQILQVCVDEWKKAERPSRQVSEQVEKLVRQKGDIVATYRQIVTTVRDRS
jgi:hypothetical protein